MRPLIPLFVVASAVALHCGSDSGNRNDIDAATDASGDVGQDVSSGGTAGGDAATCPAKAQLCSEPCVPLKAWPIDSAANCQHAMQTIACWTLSGVGGAIIGCVQDPVDHVYYLTPSGADSEYLVGTGEWTTCPDGWSFPQDPCE
jgi:hypothetical protein